MKKLILAATAALLATATLWADVGERTTYTRRARTTDTRNYNMEKSILFAENETSVDIFGTYADTDRGRYRDGFGGGVGVEHFFTKYLGIGLEGYWWGGDGPSRDVISSVSGSVIGRYPIESLHLAPYVFAGGGGHFANQDNASLHAGGGLEYRFNPNWGVFADGRHVWVDGQNDFNLVRTGVKYVF